MYADGYVHIRESEMSVSICGRFLSRELYYQFPFIFLLCEINYQIKMETMSTNIK